MGSPGVVIKDMWDRRKYASLRAEAAQLRATEKLLAEYVDGPVVEDTWSLLYKARPELLETPPEGHHRLHQVMEVLSTHPDYEALRKSTKLNARMSAMGATHMGRTIQAWLKEQADKEQQEQAQQPQAQRGGSQPQSGGAGSVGQSGDQQQSGGDPGGEQGSGEPEPESDIPFGGQALQALAAKLHAAMDELGATTQVLFGGGQSVNQEVPADVLPLADSLLQNANFLRIARLAGRMFLSSLARRKSRGRSGEDRPHIVLGNDLPNVLDEEFLGISRPLLRKEFLGRYAESELRQWEMQHHPLEMGPMVCLLDVTPSMGDHDKIIVAKAVALALAMHARRQNRSCVVIPWADAAYGMITLAPDLNPAALKQLLDLRLQGSHTPFKVPCQAMIAAINEKRRADALLITDGDDTSGEAHENWVPDFLAAKKRLECSLFATRIGHSQEGLELLKELSDLVTTAEPDPDSDGLMMILEQVA